MKGLTATTTTTTTSSNGSTATCPYAVTLQLSHDNENETTTTSQHRSSSTTTTTTDLSRCPAFQQGSCPFKDAKSAEQVRQTLLAVPPSHLQESGPFYKVLQQVHNIHPKTAAAAADSAATTTGSTGNNNNNQYVLPGGCPVQSLVVGKKEKGGAASDVTAAAAVKPHVSFTEALEEISLAAIMARLAAEMEEHHHDESSSVGSKEETEDTPPPPAATVVATTTTTTTVRPEQHVVHNEQQHRKILLSESLKSGTAVSHKDAENVHFVRNFIHGIIDRDLYAHLVTAMYYVYNTLEDLLELHAPTHFASCHFPHQLARAAALQEDMDFWHGTTFAQKVVVSPATADYLTRLEYIGRTEPLLLLAHAYTRYMGDLSGGKILARVARRAMRLDQDGLAFYQFPAIPSAKQFKDQYRTALDTLPLTPLQIHQLVAEANVAFCLNMRLFEELDVLANVPGAIVRPLQDALAYADVAANVVSATTPQVGKKSEECPFLVQQQQKGGTATVVVKPGAKRCPWPFILAHDPWEGMKDWQTWVVLGLLLCWGWNRMMK